MTTFGELRSALHARRILELRGDTFKDVPGARDYLVGVLKTWAYEDLMRVLSYDVVTLSGISIAGNGRNHFESEPCDDVDVYRYRVGGITVCEVTPAQVDGYVRAHLLEHLETFRPVWERAVDALDAERDVVHHLDTSPNSRFIQSDLGSMRTWEDWIKEVRGALAHDLDNWSDANANGFVTGEAFGWLRPIFGGYSVTHTKSGAVGTLICIGMIVRMASKEHGVWHRYTHARVAEVICRGGSDVFVFDTREMRVKVSDLHREFIAGFVRWLLKT